MLYRALNWLPTPVQSERDRHSLSKMLPLLLKALILSAIITPGLTIASEDLTQYVNPFIGTEGQGNPGTAIGAGNVFPGPALPFGDRKSVV